MMEDFIFASNNDAIKSKLLTRVDWPYHVVYIQTISSQSMSRGFNKCRASLELFIVMWLIFGACRLCQSNNCFGRDDSFSFYCLWREYAWWTHSCFWLWTVKIRSVCKLRGVNHCRNLVTLGWKESLESDRNLRNLLESDRNLKSLIRICGITW